MLSDRCSRWIRFIFRALIPAALVVLAGCSATEQEFQTSSTPSIAAPGLNGPQLTTLAAFRSVCLGTSYDQRGAERALHVLGYKLTSQDAATGEKWFAKGDARVKLTSGAQSAGSAGCVVSHDDLGRGEAAALLGEALRGAGLRSRPVEGDRALVEGSDYAGVASVLRTLGGSGLVLDKRPRPASDAEGSPAR